MAPIDIRGNVLDPAVPGDVDLPATAADTNYVLVQLNREMDQDTLVDLRKLGADVLKRMVDNTWLLHYPPTDLRVLENNVQAVEHAFVYANHFVVHNDLRADAADESTSNMQEVSIVLHEHARMDVEGALATLRGHVHSDVNTLKSGVVHMVVNLADLDRIAALEVVQAIERITPAEPYNNVIKEISGIDATNEALKDQDRSILLGEGQVVALADSGVDSTHPAFKDKIADKFILYGEDKDERGHGTHVAGTILGGPLLSWDEKDCAGMAPSARLVVQGGMWREMPAGKQLQAAQLFDRVYKNPDLYCRIHNNSWGTMWTQAQRAQLKAAGQKLPQAPYTIDDAEPVDLFALKHPDFLILFAAGNFGFEITDTGAQIGGWAAAKNVLTVGATNTNRPMSRGWFIDYSERVLRMFGQKNTKYWRQGTIAQFSSKGPCKNSRRTKPDVVAPGAGILSARSKDVDAAKIREWAEQYGTPPSGKGDDKCVFVSGTSMSTPAVAGCAALLREALAKWQGMAEPSAPLMKALFINGTDVLPNTPREVQGFGEINMLRVLRPVHMDPANIIAGKASSGWVQGSTTLDNLSVIHTYTVVAPKAESSKRISMKLTLVYHDRPGDQIQNKMNLFIDGPSIPRIDTLHSMQFDNVHQLIVGPIAEDEILTIGVESKLFLGGALTMQGAMPWAIVWDCFSA